MTSRVSALVVAAALFALGVAAAPAAADDSGLGYLCDPPQPRTAASCTQWHTAPVQLFWTFNIASYTPANVPGSDCDPQVFDADTTGTRVMCAVWRFDQTGLTNAIATIHVDQTAPTMTGFTAARPPDQDGWWNHPVALQFTGSDATSGIAVCDAFTFSGPDGDNNAVTGGCRDVAGNSASRTWTIKYDATPPALGAVSSTAAVRRNTLKWTTSADAVQTRILRSPGIGTAAVSEVYAGPGHTFTDSGVTGGKTYTYTLSASDEAANVASKTITVAVQPRLSWRRVKRADYYNVQLYKGDRKILSVWPHGTKFQLKRTWTYHGRKRVLAAGSYHWYVWPGFGKRSQHHYGKLIAHRRFRIAPAE